MYFKGNITFVNKQNKVLRLFFLELLKHTTDDHPDLAGLHASLIKMEEIANIREDKHTQLMKIFHQLLQAIHSCPVRAKSLLKKRD
jgi:hypothetical protein